MMVMPSSNAGLVVGYLAGKYPGRIGWLLSPDTWKEPHDFLSYAFDNGAFAAWTEKREWDEKAFFSQCDKIRGRTHKPMWIAVPDVVADREATLRNWFLHSPRIAAYGRPLAFVVQDGMTPDDIPPNASVVFVGGTTEWKWKSLPMWTAAFPRVHVGRVNGERALWMAHECGAESCDGTGWFRGDKQQLAGLLRYLHESTHGREQQMLL